MMQLGSNSPWLQSLRKSLEMIGSTPQGHACPDLLWQPSKAGKIQECWQVQLIVGGVGNGAAEEDWHWDLNPGVAAIPKRTMQLWWSRLGLCSFGVLPFAMWFRQQERLCLEEKG